MNYNEETIKIILGTEIYEECFAFFQEMCERNCEYKVLMTRRCFSLYKIFKPILEEYGIYNMYGKIITDKAMAFYMDDIVDKFKTASENSVVIAIFDDIIIYGRTINSLINMLLNNLQTTDNEEHYINHILVRSIMENRHGLQIKEKYRKIVTPQMHGARQEWKNISCKFSSLIKFCNMANTSYIVSYKKSIKDSNSLNMFNNYCCNKALRQQNRELSSLRINAYAILASPIPKTNIFIDYIETSWLRLYHYEENNSIVISPLVILKQLEEIQVKNLSSLLIEHLKLSEDSASRELLDSNAELLFSNKIQFITLILSHILLCDFLKQDKTLKSSDVYKCMDSDEILKHNFSIQINDEFSKISNEIYHWSNSNYIFTDTKVDSNLDDEIFDRYLFYRAMLDNNEARTIIDKRMDGFSDINSESVFSKKYMPKVLLFIDHGKAALKAVYSNGLFSSVLHPGEQAFRIMNDKFSKHLPYLAYLERYSKFYIIDQYELYNRFISFLHQKQEIDDLEKDDWNYYLDTLKTTQQEISDIYVHNFNISNSVDKKLLEDFFEKGC
jgi:hypothetical protein